MDNSEYEDLGAVLEMLKTRAGAGWVFPFKYEELAEHFNRAVDTLGTEQIGVRHLYQARHGGASHEALNASGRCAEDGRCAGEHRAR